MNRPYKFAITVLVCLCWVSGCAPKRSQSDKSTYLLDVSRPQSETIAPLPQCLHVRLCRTAAAFSGNQWVYRTGPFTYEQDYYHVFLTSPDDQITEIISQWLRDSGLFECVHQDETVTLEPHLDILCADFQDKQSPYVLIKMHISAARMDKSCSCPVTVLKKEYHAQIDLPPTPAADEIVRGMSEGLKQILTQLESDLAEQLMETGSSNDTNPH